jgi:hypothetical protein
MKEKNIKSKLERERAYGLGFADDFGDSGGGFGKDGGGVNAVKANVSRDVQTRHLFFVSLPFHALSLVSVIAKRSDFTA